MGISGQNMKQMKQKLVLFQSKIPANKVPPVFKQC